MTIERRTVLAAGAALSAGAAAALAGCTPEPAQRSTEAPQRPSTAAPSHASGGLPASGGAAVQGDASIPAAEVPVGGAAVLTDADFVVTQPTAGEYHAFSKICPHAGCPVSGIQDNRIVCPCHASAFDPTTGERLHGPAQQGLEPATVTVSGDQLIINAH